MTTESKPKPSAILHKAATEMQRMSEETTFCDLAQIYSENARLLKGAAEALDAFELEGSVLRTELAFANERANTAAENARSWYERHETLMEQLAAKQAA